MTDDEYINTANLIKLRIVSGIMRDVLPHGPVTDEQWCSVARQVRLWTDQLEAIQNSGTAKPEPEPSA